ncbi:hypothetical protein FIE12Z_10509 [Fusarium flagelliforme]|uniref:Uncharacterized protein n=1 Tax=Fusarium flagelliforme TaxID=2675880 RepID=A0A395MBJ6_9HYPO|nr:hypothetical protein FIE12Z_10509 [Fusarium flagelliforme]
MVLPNGSPPVKIEEDATYQALENAAQKSAAQKIQRLTGEWPWNILPSCSRTRWDTSLLGKLVTLLIECFPKRVGQLGHMEMRRLRAEVKSQLDSKPYNEQKALSITDLEAVRRELLKKRSTQTPNGSSKTTNMTTPTTSDSSKKRSVSAASVSEPQTTKRVRINESPPASATRSSARLRRQSQSIDARPAMPERPVNGHTSLGFALASDDENDEEDEEEPEDEIEPVRGPDEETEDSGDINQESHEAEEEDPPTSYLDNEEPLPDPVPPSANRNLTPRTSTIPRPTLTTRKPLVAEFSMSDTQIVDLLRKNITLIVSKKQYTNNQKLKDLQEESRRCELAHEKAVQETIKIFGTLNALKKSCEDADKYVQKAEIIRNKTAESLKPYQDLVNEGVGDAQLFTMLKNKVSQAEADLKKEERGRDQMKRNLQVLDQEAKRKLAAADLCKDKWNEARQLQKAHEQNNPGIGCTLTFRTDARDDEGQLFKDIFFEFKATVREQDDGVNGGRN